MKRGASRSDEVHLRVAKDSPGRLHPRSNIMNPPRWFYIIVAGSVALFAVTSGLRNLSAIGDARFSYHPRSAQHEAVVFDARTGMACVAGGAYTLCRDLGAHRQDAYRDSLVEHYPAQPGPEAPSALDTGMQMMDSTR